MISLSSVLVDRELGLNSSYLKFKLANKKKLYSYCTEHRDIYIQTPIHTYAEEGLGDNVGQGAGILSRQKSDIKFI